MKKLLTLLLVLAMCLSLAACGGVDKKPAVDAFNKTSAAFNEIAAKFNDNAEYIADEDMDQMIAMANTLNEISAKLNDSSDLTEETVNDVVSWCGDVDNWIADVNAAYDAVFGS